MMRTAFLLASIVIVASCNKPENHQDVKAAVSVSSAICKIHPKPFSNPVLIYGSDFLSFFAQLKMSYPGKLDTLLVFTSTQSKIHNSRQRILELYQGTNFNFQKKLKAIKKINDSLYVMNYLCNRFATSQIVKCRVIIEDDTARLILPINLNDLLK